MESAMTYPGSGYPSGGYLARPQPSGLAEVIDTILDKGIVIDAFVRVSLVGIELLTIDARIVIASVDTYLRFAEAVGRLNLEASNQKPGLPELLHGVKKANTERKLAKPLKKLAHPVESAKELGEEMKPKRRHLLGGRH